MVVDQMHAVLQFASVVFSLLLVGAIAMKAGGVLSKPRGTYGNGMPERRKRRRIVLPDPATLRPRLVRPGEPI